MREGTTDITALADYLMRNNSAYELAISLAELMVTAESAKLAKITVSQEEYNQIMSMFRVRGVKDSGERETRGRKRIDSKLEDD